MKRKLIKTLKILSIVIGSLVAVVLLVIAIALNFVFTPEKLTPTVVKVANSAMNAELELESVELTFFSSFPKFGLDLSHGKLTPGSATDTLTTEQEPLVSFEECRAVVNVFDYLLHDRITVKKLELNRASVHLHKDAQGKANWDIALPSDPEAVEDTTSAFSFSELEIGKVLLKEVDIAYCDEIAGTSAEMEGIDLTLSAGLDQRNIDLDLDFSNRKTALRQGGHSMVNGMQIGLTTLLHIDKQTDSVSLRNTALSLNGLRLDVTGYLKKDTLQHAMYMDMDYRLHAPSLETVLGMIPEMIVRKKEVSAKGQVTFSGKSIGYLGGGKMPEISVAAKIEDASAQYKGMPCGIDDLEMDMNLYIDPTLQKESYAHLDIFRFEGADSRISAEAHVSDLLGNAHLDFKTTSRLDLGTLAKIFPLQPGFKLKGEVVADLNMACTRDMLERKDYGKMKIKGKVDINDLSIQQKLMNSELSCDAALQFKGDDRLEAEMKIGHILLNSPFMSGSVERLSAEISAPAVKDTSSIAPLKCRVEVSEWSAVKGRELDALGRRLKAQVDLRPSEADPVLPEIKLSMSIDTVYTEMNGMIAGMDKGGFNIRSSKRSDSTWMHDGIIGFDHFSFKAAEFGLPIFFEKTAVTLIDRNLRLKNATLKIGRSDMTVSGVLYDLFGSLKDHSVLAAEMTLSSRNIDCNELIGALNAEEAVPVSQVADSVAVAADSSSVEEPLKVFVVPAGIRFSLMTDLKQVTYEKETFENVRGLVEIKNQVVHLKDLKLRGLDADMSASLLYSAKDTAQAYAGFDLRFHKVDIGRLMGMLSSLDSLVPMLKSFDGVVDFEVAAASRLDSGLNPVIPSLKSAVYLKGNDLVLMDSDTFKEISKMLMFKNKERNVVDSLALNIMVEDGNVTIPPFPLLIDRYKVAVGGKQDLDMNLDYHISVLKSPIVIKLGVNIKGNLNDIDFGMGKAKYKKEVSADKTQHSDSLRIALRDRIVADFEKRLN